MSELACVVCSSTLLTVNVEAQLVPTCPKHGAWLQEPQLRVLTDDARDDATPQQEQDALDMATPEPAELVEERFRSCPACSKTLRKDVWKYGSGVVIDVCDEHGIWVDTGELARIEAWQEALDAFEASQA